MTGFSEAIAGRSPRVLMPAGQPKDVPFRLVGRQA
jgi:hypothetical protein